MSEPIHIRLPTTLTDEQYREIKARWEERHTPGGRVLHPLVLTSKDVPGLVRLLPVTEEQAIERAQQLYVDGDMTLIELERALETILTGVLDRASELIEP